ncbi:phosphotransferase [Thalassobacillus devorans]|uniref:phosphotransferase n=1 Tax=Thalassobacillus devorans TaxID=279813 RepID=UPI0015935C1C|nr:phosphotransferase [Thalassobacillus devorans]
MEEIHNFIHSYGISGYHIRQVTDKLHRVETDNGVFAFKQSRYHSHEEDKWRPIINWLEVNGKNFAPPFARTTDGMPYVLGRSHIYYLTPWVEHTKDEYPSHDIESFFRSLGTLHKQSKQTQSDNQAYMEYLWQKKEAGIQAHQLLLEKVEAFEKRHYMPPLGLAVCSQYKQLHYTLEFMKELYQELPERDRLPDNLPHVINHGNLKNDHIIQYHGHSYFVNWEQMFVGPPMLDLSRFFLNDFRFHDSPVEEYKKKFSVYERLYGITNQERLLLAIHLIDPHHYLTRLDRLLREERSSELEKVQKLEKSFRRIVYGRLIAESLFNTFQAQQLKDNESKSTPDEKQGKSQE